MQSNYQKLETFISLDLIKSDSLKRVILIKLYFYKTN